VHIGSKEITIGKHNIGLSLHKLSMSWIVPLLFGFSALVVSSRDKIDKQQPIVISAVAPNFSGVRARLNEIEYVLIEVDIDKKGEVILSRPLHGHPVLQVLSMRAALCWRFSSTNESDETRKVRLEFIFRIMPKGTAPKDLSPAFIPPYKMEVKHLPFPKGCC
jgi:hypothetical protein